ncbi:MAG: hypothetical protein IKE42_15160 [Aquamicrobium sp.]|nr:hypothetical protein [Aquamicrobium sp.]
MSYMQDLLDREGPLEPHEVADLSQWLETLRDDCSYFGSTPEDDARMARIRAKIAENTLKVQ